MTYKIELLEGVETIAEYVCDSGAEALAMVKKILKVKHQREHLLIGSYDDDGIFYDSEWIVFEEDIKPAFFIGEGA